MGRGADKLSTSLRCVGIALGAAVAGLVPLSASAEEPLSDTIAFNFDIRPLLSEHCYECHGPDEGQRKAALRLDTRDGLFKDLAVYKIVAPGEPQESELYKRITADDPEMRMPPPDSGKTLDAEQRATIREWIEQGAQWQKHWAFIPPGRPELPQVDNEGWPRNGIDYFVLDRLEREELQPAPPAKQTTLIRRVTLDLTGLPPTPAEVDAFLNDDSPDAYEKVVDRLLDSPRYGERMAMRWLDAARYADTNGYQTDGPRSMWRWRDWVIRAYNRNMPFDRFTIEQLAGDLLPNPTLEQRIATGFNRNHRGNAEGGVIAEEFLVEYVVDRVDTTSTVWLGLTMGCARCHDHKYDPFTQKEFYRLFAFFHNVPESGKAVKYGNSPPTIQAPTRKQQRQLRDLERKLAAAEGRLRKLEPEIAAAQQQWAASLDAEETLGWTLDKHLAARYRLNGDAADATGSHEPGRYRDGEPAFLGGPLDVAGVFDGRGFIHAGDVGDFGYYDKFTLAAWISPNNKDAGTILSRMTDTARSDGYSLALEDGRLHVRLVKRWLDDAIRVETRRALEPGRWHHVTVIYDGSRVADGITVYLDGEPQPLKVNLDELNQSFRTTEPFRIGAGGGSDGRFRGRIDEVRVYDDVLTSDEARILATAAPLVRIAATLPERRTPGQSLKLRRYFLEEQAPQRFRDAWRAVVDLRDEKEQLVESFPTVMVMQEMETPRETYVLKRGEYDKPTEKVNPGVPAILPPFPEDAPRNRLGFAKWLVDPANPLTARVAVNRYWQMYFGTGIVKTLEDFGTQGARPSHPKLLDWLASEFVRTGWDVKAMQKLIVMSTTYRQSSRANPPLLERDPDNRLLARGPRFRLSAEMIRDQALAVSGLLVEKLGGPSVKPYQPSGLWKELSGQVYERDDGEALYRRSLYTYWKRTAAPPTMTTFDAAGRERCTMREPRTNTPLQALTLMNETAFVEAARKLGERMMTEAGPTPADRITRGFRLATARRPEPAELDLLVDGYRRHLAKYENDRQAAEKLLSVGESPRDETLDTAELAACTAIANLILNLDEVVTRE